MKRFLLLIIGLSACSTASVPQPPVARPPSDLSNEQHSEIVQSLRQFGVQVQFSKQLHGHAARLSWEVPPESLEDCLSRYDVASIVFEYLSRKLPKGQRPIDTEYGDFNCSAYEEEALVSGERNMKSFEDDVNSSLRNEVDALGDGSEISPAII